MEVKGKVILKKSYLLKAIVATSVLMSASSFIIPTSTSYDSINVIENKVAYKSFTANTMFDNDYLYLSDVPYLVGKTAWSSIIYDKTNSNANISLKINNSVVSFKKGIWAHANSTLVYDLTEYDFDYFTAYIGLNTTSTSGNGVKFSIYTSQDNVNWELVDAGLPNVTTPGSNATYVKVNIKGKKYLKLEALDNGGNGSDHSVYGDAKLIKNDYNDNVTMTVEEYDSLIKNKYTENNNEINDEIELLLLQKELVAKIGNYQLKSLFEENEEYKNTFNWLFNDLELMRLYVFGGNPDGTYAQSIKVLSQLYNTYKNDLNNTNLTANGVELGKIYKKMIISLSLSHSKEVSFWVWSTPADSNNIPSPNPNVSNAIIRYQIFKDLLNQNSLDANFDKLEVEEMRYIMSSQINDDEIKWLREYARSKGNNISGYSYMGYKNVNTALYRSDKFYADDISTYISKYKLSGFDVKNYKYYPRLWMIMEVGGVCWQISNVGQNVATSLGYPSFIVGQPGHSAYLVLKTNENGNGIWQIWNDVYGWTKTNLSAYNGTRGYYNVRLINNWGNGSYASSNPGSYILLGQAAINDYDNYIKSESVVKIASLYNGEKAENLYRDALNIQSINLDAWLGLINLYINDSNKSSLDYYNLALEVADKLVYYPLPMHDMLKLLDNKITDPAYKAALTNLESQSLIKATKATNADNIQSDVVRTMANYLLGIIDNKIATFSFDGVDAKKIVLSNRYTSTNSTWDYSLDGGNTWTIVDDKEILLTDEEISQINPENDIKIHIIGVNYDDINIYTIDITKASAPTNLYANDLENRVVGVTDDMEWMIDGSNNWVSYRESIPDLSRNQVVYVRTSPKETMMASESIKFDTFTENIVDEHHKYITVDNLSVNSFSSETVRPNYKQWEYAKNAIDANLYTYWHSSRVATNDERFIVIELANNKYISGLDYVPVQNYNYGLIKNAVIYSSLDGENWTEVANFSDLASDYETKSVYFDPIESKYIKLKVNQSYDYLVRDGADYFVAISMINLYEDSTLVTGPTASLEYDIRDKTNKDVTVTLVNPSTDIEVINNDGNLTYTFTENGKFTFEFKDENGNIGYATANVTWIDKTLPSVNLSYSSSTITNEDVTVKLEFNEEVEILNDELDIVKDEEIENVYYYTFMQNGGICLKYRDVVGNQNSTEISVNWIDKDFPVATFEYSIVDGNSNNVLVKLVPSEEVEIINNDGKYTYLFTENGKFTFEFQDKAGNYGTATAVVDWINNGKIKAYIKYSTDKITNQNVVATLVTDKPVQILNNYGSDNYTFTDNGKMTFEFKDEDGRVNTIEANVTWIDKVLPVAEIKYDITTKTHGPVTATIVNPSEEIKVKGIDGYSYTFTENGVYKFIIVDKALNETELIAKVDWIIPLEEDITSDKPIVNKPDNDSYQEKPNESSTNEQVVIVSKPSNKNKTNLFTMNGYAVKFEKAKYDSSKYSLSIKEFNISNKLEEELRGIKKGVKLELIDKNNKVLNIDNEKVYVTIPFDNKIIALYELSDNDQIKEIEYVIKDNKIEFETIGLKDYILVFEDDTREVNLNVEKYKEKEDFSVLIVPVSILIVLLIIWIIGKKKML